MVQDRGRTACAEIRVRRRTVSRYTAPTIQSEGTCWSGASARTAATPHARIPEPVPEHRAGPPNQADPSPRHPPKCPPGPTTDTTRPRHHDHSDERPSTAP